MSFFETTNYTYTLMEYEYTRQIRRQLEHVVESEDFQDMDVESIYAFLLDHMKSASFKDYLKRYIYEHAGLEGPFSAVTDDMYRRIIADSFDENAAPHSFGPSTVRFSSLIKGWLHHDTVRRPAVFLLGFGLRMSDEDVSLFLTKVLKDDDFNFSDPEEIVFWYCYRNSQSYAQAEALLEESKKGKHFLLSGRKNFEPVHSIEDALHARLYNKKDLMSYLSWLGRNSQSQGKKEKAHLAFMRLMEAVRVEVARILNDDPVFMDSKKKILPEDVSAGDIEKVICNGIPLTKNGNLEKASSSQLGKNFRNWRLSRQRMDGVLKRQLDVDRFDLITLIFFLYTQKEYEFPEDRYQDFIKETNRVLTDCGLINLHPVNPYEAFVMMCMLTEYPMDTYSDVWEMSYSHD